MQSFLNKPGIVYGCIGLLLLLPLVFTPQTMFPWGYGKLLVFELIIGIAALVGIIPLLKNKAGGPSWHIVDLLFMLFLFSMIVSAFFGLETIKSLWGDQSRAGGVIFWIHLGLLYTLLRGYIRTKTHWMQYTKAMVAVGLVSAIIALAGRFTPAFEGIVRDDIGLNGLAGNPIFFAAFLIIPFYISLVLVFEANTRRQRNLFILAAGFLLLTLLWTEVRGAFLGLFASMFIIGVAYSISRVGKQMHRRMLGGGIIAAVLCLVGVIAINTQTQFLASISQDVSRMFTISATGGTGQTRLMAWDIALKGFAERPVLGWGSEVYQHVFDKYYNPAFLRFSFSETVWDRPHNFFLSVLVGQGLVGLLLYLTLLGSVCILLLKRIRTEKHVRKALGYMFLLGAITHYAVQSFFGVEVLFSLLFWIPLLAYIAYSVEGLSLWRISARIQSFVLYPIIFLFFLAVPFTLISLPGLYSSTVAMAESRDIARGGGSVVEWERKAHNVLDSPVPIIWEQARYTIQDISYLDGQGTLTADSLAELAPKLVVIYEELIARNPESYQYHFWLAELYGFMAEYMDPSFYTLNKEHLLLAGERSPKQQRIPLLLSKNEILSGNVDEGVAILEALVLEDPTIEEVRWFYGLALIEQGNIDVGIEELEKSSAFGLSIDGNVLYMIDLYASQKRFTDIIPLYKLLISRHPTDATWYARMAATYAAAGNRDEMITAINTAVQLDPGLTEEAVEFLKAQGEHI